MRIMRKLLDPLDLTIETLEEFISAEGDVGYFFKLSSPIGEAVQRNSHQSLMMIMETCRRLKYLRGRLRSLRNSYGSFKYDVSKFRVS